MAQHHLWLLKLLRTTALEALGCVRQKMGRYLKIYQRSVEAAVMTGGGVCVCLLCKTWVTKLFSDVIWDTSQEGEIEIHKKCNQVQFI